MTISMLAIANAGLVLLTVAALTGVTTLGLRMHRATNEESLVRAAPTPGNLYLDKLADAA